MRNIHAIAIAIVVITLSYYACTFILCMHSVHPMRAHHAYLYVGMRLCMYACVHTCMYVGVYVRMYACMHAHMLVYIYIYAICVYALHSCAFILYALALCAHSTHSLYSLALCTRSMRIVPLVIDLVAAVAPSMQHVQSRSQNPVSSLLPSL